MNIDEMNLEQIEERLQALDAEVETSEDAEFVANATEEKRSLLERKSVLEREAEKRAKIDQLRTGFKGVNIVERGNEEMTMSNVEIRNTLEYGQAFVRGLLAGDGKFTECRALLSTGVSGGSVAVPEVLETEIKNAWNECQILSHAHNTTQKGDVKVGFEYAADAAHIHVEGTEAPEEETLEWGYVTVKAQSLKKWITISDEAIDNTTIETLQEVYKELAQKIAELAEDVAVGKIKNSPAASTKTACGVETVTSAPAVDTFLNANAKLSGKARNLFAIMNRQTKPAFKSLALNANYGIDVFDGLEDRIIYTDALPAYSAASAGDTYVIIGDLGYGLRVNRPNGNEMTLKFDDLSLAEEDLVKVVGREFVGIEVVAPKAFVQIKKA